MKSLVKEYYDLDVEIIIKLTDKVYRLKCKQGEYIFKIIDNIELESIYARISVLDLTDFLIPLKNNFDEYLSKTDDYYFEVSLYYKDELIIAKDIRLKMYLEKIALLHNKSAYEMKVNEGFYNETFEFINKEFDEAKKSLDDYLFKIEALDYKSPSEWLFLMNNQLFYKALEDGKKYIEKFKDETVNKSLLRVSLTYQNFDYSHILLKENKIIANQKMVIAPPIYDIKHLFDMSYNGAIDITGFIKDYFNSFNLMDNEKYWLISLLLLPNYKFDSLVKYSEVDSIVSITRSIEHFKSAFEIESLLINKE